MARPPGPFIAGRKYKDLVEHQKHIAFLRARAQANYRKEGWEISIEEYFEMWSTELWVNRGRAQDQFCMVRRDPEKPWSRDNCMIITRYQQLVRGKKPQRKPHEGFPE